MSRPRGATVPEPSQMTDAQRVRRTRILDAALALSTNRPFEQIQMRDVAEASGVALGTMYQYFSSKDHLFAEALAHWGGLLQDNVRARPLTGGDPAERLTEVLHRSIRAFQQQPNLAIARLDRSTGVVFREALAGLDEATAGSVVRMVDHVMAGTLRLWSAGRISIVEVYASIDEMVELLVSSHGAD
jgi:AcrR family transcriptional regulator